MISSTVSQIRGEYSKTIYWASLTITCVSPQPISLELLHYYGAALIYLNDLDKANDIYNEVLKRSNPKDYSEVMHGMAKLQLSQIKLMQHDYDGALSLLEDCRQNHHELVESSSGLHLLYTYTGWAYSGLTDYEKAEEYYLRALEYCQSNPEITTTHLANLYLHLGDIQLEIVDARRKANKDERLGQAITYYKNAILSQAINKIKKINDACQ